MNKWWALVVVGTLASGCISQAHPVNSSWNGSSEPDCDDSYEVVAGDRLAGDAAVGVSHAVAKRTKDRGMRAAVGVLGLFAGVAAEVAAQEDRRQVHECRVAKNEWYAAQAETAHRPHDPGVLQPTPRGFYCTRSTSQDDISICTRDLAACTDERDAATLGLPDLGRCATADNAWCVVGHCYANAASCERRRGPDTIGRCEQLD
jgi:hypothetical protein